MLKLRPNQEFNIEGLREGFAAGHRAQILYGPTGFGKTEIAISMLKYAAEKNNRVAMLVDRRILADQTSERLNKYDIDHSVMMSGHWRYRPDNKIQICSVQTLEAMGCFPDVKLMIIDEAHCSRKSVIEFIKNNPKVKVVGLSATPFTRGLGATYSNIISRTTTRELVDDGRLAPLRVFLAKEIDMTGAKKVAGEWSDKETTARGIQITGDVVSEWVNKTHEIFGEPKKTIVFCASVAHGSDLQSKFAEPGYNFVSISYKDDEEFKADVFAEFAKPESTIQGIIATDILTKGFDCPDVMIGISARPFSKSFSSHVQQMGRVMREFAGKEFGVWLDHSGNYLRFKDQWDELYSSGVSGLDDGAEKAKPEPTSIEKDKAKCPKCGALWPGNSDVCCHCGHVRPIRNEVVNVPGQMLELTMQDAVKPEKYSSEYREQWYQGLIATLRNAGKNENRAYHLYREKFKVDPAWKKVPGSVITKAACDAQAYMQRANIAFAKSRK
jgi:DNA repair protein RadD